MKFIFFEKNVYFLKFCCQPQNLKLGPSIAMCLESPKFESRCAYELNKVGETDRQNVTHLGSHFRFCSIWRVGVMRIGLD